MAAIKPCTAALALVFAIASCATPVSAPPPVNKKERAGEVLQQREAALQTGLAKTLRISNIAFALEQANAPLCPRVHPMYGFGMHAKAQYEGRFSKAAMALYHFADAPKVSYVIKGSPAQKAGLQAGDELAAINGEALKGGKKVLAGVLKKLNALKGNSAALRVRRGGQSLDLTMAPVSVCDIAIGRSSSAAINARAYPKTILVNDGMLRFVRSDDELALVIAHELAHFSMGHIRAEGRNISAGFAAGLALDVALASVGIILPALFTQAGAGAAYMAYSADFEREADYVGAYYLVRAGFDASGVEAFWRRMGAQSPGNIDERSSHPPSAERYIGIRKTLAEIAKKQAAGEPLVPNIKPGRAPLKERKRARRLPDEAL